MATVARDSDVAARDVSPHIPLPLLRYVARVKGDAAVRRVLELAGVDWTIDELESGSRWVGTDEVIATAAAAADVCGDPEIGRRAGEQLFLQGCETGVDSFIVAAGSIEAACTGLVEYGTRMSSGRPLRVTDAGDGHLTIEARYLNARMNDRFFCAFTAGYYAMVPSLFGKLGFVTEPRCQLRGDSHCEFQLVWEDDPRLAGEEPVDIAEGIARAEGQLVRFESLQEMASELVRAEDLSSALDRITQGVGVALQAPRYVLAVRPSDHDRLRVHHHGFTNEAHAEAFAARLIAGDVTEDEGALVAEVASHRRHYGYLATLYVEGTKFDDIGRRLLEAYAGHATAVLEVISSLETARRDRDTARALLGLAHELAEVGTANDVFGRLSTAVSTAVKCELATVWTWDDDSSCLHLQSWHDCDRSDLPSVPTTIDERMVPGLRDRIGDPSPVLLRVAEAAPDIKRIYEAMGIVDAAIVPISAHGALLGFVMAGFRHELPDALRPQLLELLGGLAGQAATALQNAQLLDEIRHRALHDALTGLPNRPLAQDRATQALRAARRSGKGVGVLFIDLDRFKNVNDTLGHGAGDDLIRKAAGRLAGIVREGDTLARLGGDEFLVLVPEIEDDGNAVEVARRAIAALAGPFVVSGQELFISCSIGIACAPDHGDDYGTLLQRADAAMYQAKAQGRGTFAVYSGPVGGSRREQLELESRLHKAIERDELRVLYQPQVDLATMRVTGVEALVRWQHPELGLLGPAAFIPLAEESGLITSIDQWVRRQAFGQAKVWADAETHLRIAVNLSTRELRNPQLASELALEIAESGISPEMVELEITDRVVMSDAELPEILHELQALGVRLAIDDFGTGNSVLGRLQRCPVDTLKIDKSFVHEVGVDSPEGPVVKALVALAHSLDLCVVAEGVETAAQAAMLRRYGCEIAQGFYFSRPVAPDVVERLFKEPLDP